MFRRNRNRRLIIAVFVAAVGSLGMTTEGKGQIWSFEKDEVGGPPAGFEFAVTAKKQPGKWIIVKDGDNQVLAQVDRDKTERRFAMALVKSSYKDLKISVKAKPVAGEHRGEDIVVFVGKEKVFEGKDKAYTDAGRTGVWIKADSLTYFDDLTVQGLK